MLQSTRFSLLNKLGSYYQKNSIIKNFIFLSFYQLTNLLFPLIISPFLISKIGIGKFGLVTTAQALMSFYIVICDFGFNLSATKNISINRNNIKEISSTVNSVFLIKLFLFPATILINFFLVEFITQFNAYSFLNITSLCLVIGRLFFPVWLYQGIEKMYFLILFALISKILAAIFIFFLVRTPQDYTMVNIIIGLSDFVSCIVIVAYSFFKLKIKIEKPERRLVKKHAKEGMFFFLINFSINVYINSNPIVLSFFCTPRELGIYTIAEKVMLLIKQISNLIFQTTYSHACYLYSKSIDLFKSFLNNLFYFLLLIFCVICILLIIFSGFIAIFFSKSETSSISNLIRIFSFIPLIVALNMPAYQMLLITNRDRDYLKITIAGACINVIFNIVLSFYFTYWGTVTAIFITELFITITSYTILYYRHKNLQFINYRKIKFKMWQ